MAPAFEPIHHISQATRALGQIWRINLGDITQADNLGARTGTGHQRLDLFGSQILGFINNDKLVDEGTAAHKVERLDLDLGADQVLGSCPTPVATIIVGLVEYFQIVVKGAHPWRHFFFFGTRKKTDIFTDRHRDPGDDDYLGQTSSQCQQGFAGTGLTEQGHKIAFRVHEQIERKILFAIA